MKQKYYWIIGFFILIGVFLAFLILSNVRESGQKDFGEGSLEIAFSSDSVGSIIAVPQECENVERGPALESCIREVNTRNSDYIVDVKVINIEEAVYNGSGEYEGQSWPVKYNKMEIINQIEGDLGVSELFIRTNPGFSDDPTFEIEKNYRLYLYYNEQLDQIMFTGSYSGVEEII